MAPLKALIRKMPPALLGLLSLMAGVGLIWFYVGFIQVNLLLCQFCYEVHQRFPEDPKFGVVPLLLMVTDNNLLSVLLLLVNLALIFIIPIMTFFCLRITFRQLRRMRQRNDDEPQDSTRITKESES